ncbi:MAG: phosphoribosylaminoimidazolesuccinocarboxamide synthase [Candidatus Syntropharchaeia archaeon]
MNLIKRGSVKDIYEVDDELEFVFTDRISVFDKVIPVLIPDKGETLCREGVYWFRRAEKLGFLTHFIDYFPRRGMRVKKVDVIRNYSLLNEKTRNYLIPIEFISRYYIAGSLYDRIKKGKIKPEEIGLKRIEYGEELPQPFFECSTKLEEVDRLLKEEEVLKISGLRREEYEEIQEMVLKMDEEINSEVKKRGLIHVDGKKEFAFDPERNLMIVDVFGTADEDRFWDAKKYDEGKFIELSKEFVRQYYRKIGYKDRLYAARERGEPEPEIPPLPEDMVEKAREIYIDLFERITGERFR